MTGDKPRWGRVIVAAGIALAVVGALEAGRVGTHLAVLMLLLAAAWCAIATFMTRAAVAATQVAEIDAPDACRALVPIALRLTLENTSRWCPLMFGVIRVKVRSSGDHIFETSARRIGFLPPGARMSFEWRVTMRGRGPHTAAAVSLAAQIPGALSAAGRELACAASIAVLPAVTELRPNAIHLVAGRRMATGRLKALPIAMEEYIGVRDYRPGDNPRLLHRVLSLRHPGFPAQLVVREFEDPSIDDVCLIVDHAPPSDPADVDAYAYRLEKALCFVAAFTRLLTAQKLRSRVLVPGHPAIGAAGLRIQGESTINRLERALSRVSLTGDPTEIDRTLYREARFGNAAVLFVSLREVAVEDRNRRLAVQTVLPDTVHALTRRLVHA